MPISAEVDWQPTLNLGVLISFLVCYLVLAINDPAPFSP